MSGKFYAGVGSRKTPNHVLDSMRRVAGGLYGRGFALRSGGAEGADTAFIEGARRALLRDEWFDAVELYLPWSGFGDWESMRQRHGFNVITRPTPRAFEIAAIHHPVWQKLDRGPRALHARNVHQVLGADCETPSRFVLCWTPDGAETKTTPDTGGTGQAIRIAVAHGVPVINMANEGWERRVDEVAR